MPKVNQLIIFIQFWKHDVLVVETEFSLPYVQVIFFYYTVSPHLLNFILHCLSSFIQAFKGPIYNFSYHSLSSPSLPSSNYNYRFCIAASSGISKCDFLQWHIRRSWQGHALCALSVCTFKCEMWTCICERGTGRGKKEIHITINKIQNSELTEV